MVHRFAAHDMDRLKNHHRQEVQPAEDIIERASPYSHEMCADLGSGNGYITAPLAEQVRLVVALDSQKEMLESLMLSLSHVQREKVRTVIAELPELPFADASLDRVFLINVLHEFENKSRLVAEIGRVLKDQGRVSLVDFQKKETSFGPPLSERIGYDEIESIFHGMTAVESWSFDEFYQFEMVKD